MSVEDLKKFGEMCNEREEVRNKALEIGVNNPKGLIAYGKELGLDFNEDDMIEAAKEGGFSLDELSEEDLEKISGGAVSLTSILVGGIALAVVGVAAVAAVGTIVGIAVVDAVVAKWSGSGSPPK